MLVYETPDLLVEANETGELFVSNKTNPSTKLHIHAVSGGKMFICLPNPKGMFTVVSSHHQPAVMAIPDPDQNYQDTSDYGS